MTDTKGMLKGTMIEFYLSLYLINFEARTKVARYDQGVLAQSTKEHVYGNVRVKICCQLLKRTSTIFDGFCPCLPKNFTFKQTTYRDP